MSNRSGQALLLVLVGMGAVMTLVLSVVSRSITDISISSREDEASRAFSAAEAGIERVLIGIGTTGDSLGNNSSYTSQKIGLSEGGLMYNAPDSIKSGEFVTIWYVSHDSEGKMTCSGGKTCYGGDLKVSWGDVGTSEKPAIEVAVFYDAVNPYKALSSNPDFSDVRVARAAFDPEAARVNSFDKTVSTSGCDVDGKAYAFCKNILIGSSMAPSGSRILFTRVKLLYNNTDGQSVGVVAAAPLPAQGYRITSTGVSGDTSRKIEVVQTYKDIMPFLDAALYSGSSLSKN